MILQHTFHGQLLIYLRCCFYFVFQSSLGLQNCFFPLCFTFLPVSLSAIFFETNTCSLCNIGTKPSSQNFGQRSGIKFQKLMKMLSNYSSNIIFLLLTGTIACTPISTVFLYLLSLFYLTQRMQIYQES